MIPPPGQRPAPLSSRCCALAVFASHSQQSQSTEHSADKGGRVGEGASHWGRTDAAWCGRCRRRAPPPPQAGRQASRQERACAVLSLAFGNLDGACSQKSLELSHLFCLRRLRRRHSRLLDVMGWRVGGVWGSGGEASRHSRAGAAVPLAASAAGSGEQASPSRPQRGPPPSAPQRTCTSCCLAAWPRPRLACRAASRARASANESPPPPPITSIPCTRVERGEARGTGRVWPGGVQRRACAVEGRTARGPTRAQPPGAPSA